MATDKPLAVAQPRAWVRLIVPLAALTLLWLLLCRQLSAEWSLNEQYSYGWFVPFFCLYLFWLRWETRPPEGRAPSRPNPRTAQRLPAQSFGVAIALALLFLLFPLRLFEIANPDWRPLSWLHALAVVAFTLLFLWSIGGARWLRHFAFPVAFMLVAVPWPSGIETRVIQSLMRIVAEVATDAAGLFGIPAELQGNLIRVSTGIVGISEACSGVRSLQTSLMIGLLFGELKRLSILRRIALIAIAAAIALVANFVRAVFLVWIAARENVAAVSRWHDLAGYFIVGLVFVGTLAAAALIAKGKSQTNREQPTEDSNSGLVTRHPSLVTFSLVVIVWLLLIELGCAAWYRSHERNLVASVRWQAQWPQSAPGYRQVKIDEDARRILRFDDGNAASWMVSTVEQPVICSMFFFRWDPGRNSALLANLHRPDVCLPAIGWKQTSDLGVREYSVAPAFALPFRHFEFERNAGHSRQVAHAFYCLWEDRAPAPSAGAAKLPQMSGERSSWTRGERARAVLEGRRHLGQQVLEIVLVSRQPIAAEDAEKEFTRLLPSLVRLPGSAL